MLATCPYPEPARSTPYPPHPTSRSSILILSSHLRLGLPSCIFPSGLPHQNPVHLLSPLHATSLAYLLRAHTGVIYFSGTHLNDHPPFPIFCAESVFCAFSPMCGILPFWSRLIHWTEPHAITAVFICPYKSASLPLVCGCETREIECFESIDFEESLWTREGRVTGDQRKALNFWSVLFPAVRVI